MIDTVSIQVFDCRSLNYAEAFGIMLLDCMSIEDFDIGCDAQRAVISLGQRWIERCIPPTSVVYYNDFHTVKFVGDITGIKIQYYDGKVLDENNKNCFYESFISADQMYDNGWINSDYWKED